MSPHRPERHVPWIAGQGHQASPGLSIAPRLQQHETRRRAEGSRQDDQSDVHSRVGEFAPLPAL